MTGIAEYRIGKRTDMVAGHEVFELWQRLDTTDEVVDDDRDDYAP